MLTISAGDQNDDKNGRQRRDDRAPFQERHHARIGFFVRLHVVVARHLSSLLNLSVSVSFNRPEAVPQASIAIFASSVVKTLAFRPLQAVKPVFTLRPYAHA